MLFSDFWMKVAAMTFCSGLPAHHFKNFKFWSCRNPRCTSPSLFQFLSRFQPSHWGGTGHSSTCLPDSNWGAPGSTGRSRFKARESRQSRQSQAQAWAWARGSGCEALLLFSFCKQRLTLRLYWLHIREKKLRAQEAACLVDNESLVIFKEMTLKKGGYYQSQLSLHFPSQ